MEKAFIRALIKFHAGICISCFSLLQKLAILFVSIYISLRFRLLDLGPAHYIFVCFEMFILCDGSWYTKTDKRMM